MASINTHIDDICNIPSFFIIYFCISVIVLTLSSLQEQAMTLGIYVMESNLWDLEASLPVLLIFILLKILCNYVWVSHTRHKKGTWYYYIIIELLK